MLVENNCENFSTNHVFFHWKVYGIWLYFPKPLAYDCHQQWCFCCRMYALWIRCLFYSLLFFFSFILIWWPIRVNFVLLFSYFKIPIHQLYFVSTIFFKKMPFSSRMWFDCLIILSPCAFIILSASFHH